MLCGIKPLPRKTFTFKTFSMLSMYILRPKALSVAAIGFVVLVKTHGADARPNGRHPNWYTCPSHLNLRRRWWAGLIGIMKYASFRYTFVIQSPSLRTSYSRWIPSILKWFVTTYEFSAFRLITGLVPPS